jgi:hypothetical protein
MRLAIRSKKLVEKGSLLDAEQGLMILLAEAEEGILIFLIFGLPKSSAERFLAVLALPALVESFVVHLRNVVAVADYSMASAERAGRAR